MYEISLTELWGRGGGTPGEIPPDENFVRVHYGLLPEARGAESLIRVAHRHDGTRALLSNLTNMGFYTYKADEASSSLVRDRHVADLWHRVRDGAFNVYHGRTIYKVDAQRNNCPASSLVVVFSSMSESIFSPSLMRYFEPNFRSIARYISDSSVVLRIADIGGVVGAFYSNTVALPDNVPRVHALIEMVREQHGVDSSRVVLYGASKGGTAALYHGLRCSYSFVSVDPIVDDAYYEITHRDSHFTNSGIFLERKVDMFRNLKVGAVSPGSRMIITSPHSPQFRYIMELPGDVLSQVSVVESMHPEIREHAEVSPRTLHVATAAINWFCAGFGAISAKRVVIH